MVVTEDSEDGTRKVVAFGRYFKYSEGEFNQDWKTRWEPELPVDMKDETLGDGFMDPLARQQRAVMAERAHWCMPAFHSLRKSCCDRNELMKSSS